MAKINITKEQVCGFVKNCCMAVFGAMVIAGAYFCRSTTSSVSQETSGVPKVPEVYKTVTSTYGGAVDAIVNSLMSDFYKENVIELLKRDGDADYYSAVISTVQSDMSDFRIVEVIKTLSAK